MRSGCNSEVGGSLAGLLRGLFAFTSCSGLAALCNTRPASITDSHLMLQAASSLLSTFITLPNAIHHVYLAFWAASAADCCDHRLALAATVIPGIIPTRVPQQDGEREGIPTSACARPTLSITPVEEMPAFAALHRHYHDRHDHAVELTACCEVNAEAVAFSARCRLPARKHG